MKKLLLIFLFFFIFSGFKIEKIFIHKETENQIVLIDEYRYKKGFLTNLMSKTVPLFGLFDDGDIFDFDDK